MGGDDDLICRVKIIGFGNINTINGMEGIILSDREGFHQAFVAYRLQWSRMYKIYTELFYVNK